MLPSDRKGRTAVKFALALGAAMVLSSPTGLGASTFEIGINSICGAEIALAAGVASNGAIRAGVGTSLFSANSANAPAQAWFEYGLQAYHAFLHAETKQALAKAAALDPGCAMCAWGEALSLGSTLMHQTPGSVMWLDRVSARDFRLGRFAGDFESIRQSVI